MLIRWVLFWTSVNFCILCHANAEETSKYRGWDFLVHELQAAGVEQQLIDLVYTDPRMPEFTSVGFGLRPKESPTLYKGFNKKSRVEPATAFLREHSEEFEFAEQRFEVDRSVIAAIILVESHFGKVTGKDLIINRLSRLASAASPENVVANYKRLLLDGKTVTFEEVQVRAKYLYSTFFPELPAFFELIQKTGADPFEITGSSAGAFGMPQFLPSAYIKYGVDGDNDGFVSLFNPADSILSTANFLNSNGWRKDATHGQKRQSLWTYNRSDAYIDTILKLAKWIDETSPSTSTTTPKLKLASFKKNSATQSGSTQRKL